MSIAEPLKQTKIILEGLNCAGCAAKIENAFKKDPRMNATDINFSTKTVWLNPDMMDKAQAIVDTIEHGVKLVPAVKEQSAEESETYHQKNQLVLIGLSAVLLVIGILFENQLHGKSYSFVEYIIFLAGYLLVGGKILLQAFRNFSRGQFFDEYFLMSVATIGAIIVHQLPEAVGVMLFFAVGEFFQDLAVNRSRQSIQALMDIRPDFAHLKVNNEVRTVSPEEVSVGDAIIVKPGEKVPLDGKVIEGSSFLDTSALTGESVPRKVETGEAVLAGMVNSSGLLTVKVEKSFGESSVAKILDLVENAGTRKAPTEQFITKFSRYYTPVVVFSALALAVVPPLVLPGATFHEWFYRALILLVISCPCALVVSVPLGYFGGIGGASKRGILIKGANFLEALTDLRIVALDKTGTITKGIFKVTEISPQNGFNQEQLLEYAAMAEAHSSHPIAKSILEYYNKDINEKLISNYEEISGYGIKAAIGGKIVIAGNEKLMHCENIRHNAREAAGTVVFIAVDGIFAGYIIIADEIKADSKEAIKQLKALGVKEVVMLTGDHEAVARRVAEEVGADNVYAELLPQDKVAKIEELERTLGERRKYKVGFVGDGINDAPVITKADVGIAMGGLGSDAAIEAADVVIMEDMISKLPTAIGIARKTRKIIVQNIVFALVVKGGFIALGAVGVATMWEAVFADVGVTLLAILNSSRALRYSEK
ncbi:MAG: heavy metal translocating P-type ATPase [Thermincola sp.]|jgi:Cd2+/Zn2+-exporting ATPase|nr:heavy metal translocating P-type ATPase [Thermincola sp.]MDT3704753.1 heavy metal translocating P-type ATPase [Thermincola sp.]